MSNNTVHVTGYLNVQKVETLTQKSRPWPIVTGHIHTDAPLWGGVQPFVADDRQAEVILDFARQYNLTPKDAVRCGTEHHCGKEHRYGVLAHAKLVSFSHRSYLALRFISFFDTSAPVLSQPDSFARSVVNLQGYLTIAGQQYRELTRQETGLPEDLLCLQGSLATASTEEGGRHPILFSGPLLKELRARADFQAVFRRNHTFTVAATLSGRLFAKGQIVYVMADYLSADLCSRPCSSGAASFAAVGRQAGFI